MSYHDALSEQHRACDIAFAEIETAAQEARWMDAVQLLDAFVTEIESHFHYEENVLFPALQRVQPMASQPVAVMLSEHEQIREFIKDLRSAVDGQRSDEVDGLAQTLMFVIQQHNAKEEAVLYPLADQLLTVDHELEAAQHLKHA